MVHFANDWDDLLQSEFQKEYYQRLRAFLKREYATRTVYPAMTDIFNAMKLTPYRDVKTVILGQDPYHGAGQAHGLAFSVQKGVDIPPSLFNIFRELQTDVGCYIPNNGYLEPWARQGVLLLNAALTVRAGAPNSHRGMGWEQFTDHVISLLNERADPMIFLLWGRNAREKKPLISNPAHRVLEAPHPSPMSAGYGFFGCRHFSKTNALLGEMGQGPVDWQIPNL